MSQFDEKSHWPLHDGKDCRSRCKMAGCNFFSHWFCGKCQKHLCMTSNRNCFYAYHHQITDENQKNIRRNGGQPDFSQTTKSQLGKRNLSNNPPIAGKKSLDRRSSNRTVTTAKIACSRQSQNIKKQPKQTAAATKQLVRDTKAVNLSVSEKCDPGGVNKTRVLSPSKMKFMSALNLTCV